MAPCILTGRKGMEAPGEKVSMRVERDRIGELIHGLSVWWGVGIYGFESVRWQTLEPLPKQSSTLEGWEIGSL